MRYARNWNINDVLLLRDGTATVHLPILKWNRIWTWHPQCSLRACWVPLKLHPHALFVASADNDRVSSRLLGKCFAELPAIMRSLMPWGYGMACLDWTNADICHERPAAKMFVLRLIFQFFSYLRRRSEIGRVSFSAYCKVFIYCSRFGKHVWVVT